MTRIEIKESILSYGTSLMYHGMNIGSPLINPADKICDDFEQKLKDAYMAGWDESGEGWNAEYGVGRNTIVKMCEDYTKEVLNAK